MASFTPMLEGVIAITRERFPRTASNSIALKLNLIPKPSNKKYRLLACKVIETSVRAVILIKSE